MSVSGRLTGRRLLITGGSSGIGLATARLFIAAGARVAILARDQVKLEAAARETRAFPLTADVRDPVQTALAIEAAADRLGGLDGLVCAAGINIGRTVEDTTDTIWHDLIATNLSGSFYACRAALPHLKRGRDESPSTIVTIASGAALLPPAPQIAAYAASKGGVLSMTKAMALELAPAVRVNAVLPGNAATPLTQAIMDQLDEKQRARKLGAYAMRRLGEPEEIANAVLFLTSDESSYMTGASLSVDGGRIFH